MNVNSVGKANLERQSVERPSALASIRNHVGLRGIAAVLPPRTRDLEDLQRSGLLVSDLEALKELGFREGPCLRSRTQCGLVDIGIRPAGDDSS